MPVLPRLLSLFLLLFASASAVAAIDEADLLPVDDAFALSARVVAPDRIEVQWKIADGYYLYRHRITAQAVEAADQAGTIALPHGDPHTDEFFGKVETFRGTVTGTLDKVAAPSGQLRLKVKYQGCADLGICYPPQTRMLTVALSTPSTPAAGGDGSLAALGRALAGGQPMTAPGGSIPAGTDALPLPPEQAFGFEAIAGDGNTLLLRFTPAKGYYLYRDRSSFRLLGAAGVEAQRPRWPKGVSHRDEHFGNVVVYFDQVDVPLPLARTRPDAVKAQLVATFQGCQTDGICYPPMTRTLSLSIPAGRIGGVASAIEPSAPASAAVAGSPGDANAGATEVATNAPPAAQGAAAAVASSEAGKLAAIAAPARAGDNAVAQAEDSRLAAGLSGSNRWLALLGFFGAGLLLAFTPCVLPMVPILSGLIAGRGERIGAMRAFWLSLVYVLASAVVFTIAGVVAGLLGANLQVAFQTPWILVLFALLFVTLSLSMFGYYELQLPAALRNRLGGMTDRQRGGSWIGVAAMGALSALIVGPCVAPPLAAAVLYIGQTRDPLFGGAALFLLAMGMGTPLLAFGVAAGRGLPTSGPWMIAIQRVFGFVFLGLAVWMLSRIVPPAATLALFGLLGLAMAAWLFGLASPRAGDGPDDPGRTALRFAGLVLGLVGAAELFGALGGGSDPVQPLASRSSQGAPRSELAFRTIKTVEDLDREVAAAKAAGKPLLFDFYADWCVSCKEMEKYTFTRPEVHAALADFVLLKADVTANDAADQALMKRLGIIGPPATLFYVTGVERRELRLFGFEKAAPFVQRIGRAQ